MQRIFYAKWKFKHLFLPIDYPQADSLNTLKRLSSASCRKKIPSQFLHYLWDRVVPFSKEKALIMALALGKIFCCEAAIWCCRGLTIWCIYGLEKKVA